MLTIRAQVKAAQAAINLTELHLAAADTHAAAGDRRETENQLRLAVSALDTARELAERAAIRAAMPNVAAPSEGAMGIGTTAAPGHDAPEASSDEEALEPCGSAEWSGVDHEPVPAAHGRS